MIFTPPTTNEVPPISVADDRHSAPTARANPLGYRLMRFYDSRPRGAAVFKMSDGTYRINRQVPGLNVPYAEPYPPVPEFASNDNGGVGVVNDALGWSYVYEQGTVIPLDQPTVSIVYYGGMSHPVSSAEAASLTAAGFGAYLS